jgi:two-component system, cell cycle sensor histidine kinase and response regulator CckA
MNGGEPDARTLMVLGRLAGGVAHDFNNQLTSIIGYADLLLFDMREDDPARQDLVEIRRAAERAHLVTRQLSAFSRPHPPQPVVLNVAHTVTASVRLLKRILGDDIQLVTVMDEAAVDREPALVRADASHLGRMLLCLAVRARDTLPRGGALTIALVNHEDSVRLLVSTSGPHSDRVDTTATPGPPGAPDALDTPDTPGAPEALDARPDTELSIVEEIVRECEGTLRVEETRAIIQLPRVDRSDSGVVIESALPAGDEEVLIVEDDGGVRNLVGTVLERQGYHVTRVEHPTQALTLARSPRRIDLAIIDVILPEQRGDELAAELQELRPGLRVLFMSGHTAREIGDVATGARGIFLHKPFTPNELLVRVRQALDNAAIV